MAVFWRVRHIYQCATVLLLRTRTLDVGRPRCHSLLRRPALWQGRPTGPTRRDGAGEEERLCPPPRWMWWWSRGRLSAAVPTVELTIRARAAALPDKKSSPTPTLLRMGRRHPRLWRRPHPSLKGFRRLERTSRQNRHRRRQRP